MGNLPIEDISAIIIIPELYSEDDWVLDFENE
jgi:hypothetical protein